MSGLGNGVDDVLLGLPSVAVDGDNIEIISDPNEFYERLTVLARQSKKRIVIASLYVGNGPLEEKFLRAVGDSSASRVSILLDHCRGTRPPNSSCHMLRPLLDKCSNITVHLFHTPALRGILRRLLPERWNEVIGLQHMKVYIFDDTTVLTGANLSETYFTNRQDRCIVVKDCARLADIYDGVVDAVGSCSMRLRADGSVTVDERCEHHPINGDQRKFMAQLRDRVTSALSKSAPPPTHRQGGDTTVWPYVQYGDAGIDTEIDLLSQLLRLRNRRLAIYLASGYFNLMEHYTGLIRDVGEYSLTLLCASPMANGFFGARGLSKYVPGIYSCAAKQFIEGTRQSDCAVDTLEFDRAGWTFHAKGIWLSEGEEEETPFATLVGSSNYGERSGGRDVECGLFLVTKNEHLRRRLYEERQHLLQYCQPINVNATYHYTPMWLRMIFKFARRFF